MSEKAKQMLLKQKSAQKDWLSFQKMKILTVYQN